MTAAIGAPPSRFRLDPRTKLLLLLLMNVIVFTYRGSVAIGLGIALAAALTLVAGQWKPIATFAATYAVLFTIDAVIDAAPRPVIELWVAISLPFFIALPTAIYALLLITTTTMSELSAALQKLWVPAAAMIPLLVFVRFVPAIVQDFRAITTAMRLRGATGRGNPLKAMEYVYVPLLLGLVRTGDQLTVAALTRGLGRHRTRTYVVEPRLRLIDAVAVIAMAALVIFARTTAS
ncbi:MAG: energy-coupling factor transporter transmembrane component T [Actinomycetota bacterium]